MAKKDKLIKNAWTLNRSISVRYIAGSESVVFDVDALLKSPHGLIPRNTTFNIFFPEGQT